MSLTWSMRDVLVETFNDLLEKDLSYSDFTGIADDIFKVTGNNVIRWSTSSEGLYFEMRDGSVTYHPYDEQAEIMIYGGRSYKFSGSMLKLA